MRKKYRYDGRDFDTITDLARYANVSRNALTKRISPNQRNEPVAYAVAALKASGNVFVCEREKINKAARARTAAKRAARGASVLPEHPNALKLAEKRRESALMAKGAGAIMKYSAEKLRDNLGNRLARMAI